MYKRCIWGIDLNAIGKVNLVPVFSGTKKKKKTQTGPEVFQDECSVSCHLEGKREGGQVRTNNSTRSEILAEANSKLGEVDISPLQTGIIRCQIKMHDFPFYNMVLL